jgi:hypothetical protein
MDKVVPCLIPYKSIIYLAIVDQDKAGFLSNQILFSLKFVLNQKQHCARGPAHGNGPATATRPDPPPSHPLPRSRWTTAGRPRQPCTAAGARHPHTVLLRVARPNPSLPSSFLRVVPPAPDPHHPLLSSSSVPRDHKRASTAPAIPFPVSTPP